MGQRERAFKTGCSKRKTLQLLIICQIIILGLFLVLRSRPAPWLCIACGAFRLFFFCTRGYEHTHAPKCFVFLFFYPVTSFTLQVPTLLTNMPEYYSYPRYREGKTFWYSPCCASPFLPASVRTSHISWCSKSCGLNQNFKIM